MAPRGSFKRVSPRGSRGKKNAPALNLKEGGKGRPGRLERTDAVPSPACGRATQKGGAASILLRKKGPFEKGGLMYHQLKLKWGGEVAWAANSEKKVILQQRGRGRGPGQATSGGKKSLVLRDVNAQLEKKGVPKPLGWGEVAEVGGGVIMLLEKHQSGGVAGLETRQKEGGVLRGQLTKEGGQGGGTEKNHESAHQHDTMEKNGPPLRRREKSRLPTRGKLHTH